MRDLMKSGLHIYIYTADDSLIPVHFRIRITTHSLTLIVVHSNRNFETSRY